jgi:hypothetical protein
LVFVDDQHLVVGSIEQGGAFVIYTTTPQSTTVLYNAPAYAPTLTMSDPPGAERYVFISGQTPGLVDAQTAMTYQLDIISPNWPPPIVSSDREFIAYLYLRTLVGNQQVLGVAAASVGPLPGEVVHEWPDSLGANGAQLSSLSFLTGTDLLGVRTGIYAEGELRVVDLKQAMLVFFNVYVPNFEMRGPPDTIYFTSTMPSPGAVPENKLSVYVSPLP